MWRLDETILAYRSAILRATSTRVEVSDPADHRDRSRSHVGQVDEVVRC